MQPDTKARVALSVFFCLSMLLSACDAPKKESIQTVAIAAPSKPWILSLDSNYLLQNPDRYAWDMFRAVNWPADTTLLVADTTKILGDSGWVVWQTWKTGPEIYKADGSKPKDWLDKDFGLRSTENFQQFSIKARMPDITLDPTFGLEEVVLNKSTFDYVVQNQLYNLNGQLAFYLSGVQMKFPTESVEIKVKWRKIPDTHYDKARYHWQYIQTKKGNKVSVDLYGLVAMHLTSKVLGKWFWATFEHIDSRSQKHPGDDGWLLPTRDRFACSEPPYDCERAPTNIGLEGTKWEYFLLRGTQIDYLEENGKPSLLANSNVERGFQLSSSCITCHSFASVGPVDHPKDPKDTTLQRVNFLPGSPLFSNQFNGVFFGGKGYVGVPDTSLFRLPNGVRMGQTDFAWSLSEASWITSNTSAAKK